MKKKMRVALSMLLPLSVSAMHIGALHDTVFRPNSLSKGKNASDALRDEAFMNTLCTRFSVPSLAALTAISLKEQGIEDFNIAEIKKMLPHLTFLDLSKNKIKILSQQFVKGMGKNFLLDLSNNPIRWIDEDFLTPEIIRNASSSHIHVKNTLLTRQQFQTLEDRHRNWHMPAIIAAQGTHIVINALVASSIVAMPWIGRAYGPQMANWGSIASLVAAASYFFLMIGRWGSLRPDLLGYYAEIPKDCLSIEGTIDGTPKTVFCYSKPFAEYYAYCVKDLAPVGFLFRLPRQSI